MKSTLAFLVLSWATSLSAQYAGPAILTRGEVPSAMATSQISFRPFGEITGVYDTGLAAVGTAGAQGALGNAASYGVELSGGVSGLRGWGHTRIGLDYRGSLTRYSQHTNFNSSSQSLFLKISHQLTPHTTLALKESAGLFSRSYGSVGPSQTATSDPLAGYAPSSGFYDDRVLYGSTQADLTIQQSSHLSFNLGGDGFKYQPRSAALYGVTGAGARGDAQYRLSRFTTIGAGYSFAKYVFHGVSGGTDIHTLVGTYAVRLTRQLEFSALGGVTHEETQFTQPSAANPAITALLGPAGGAVTVHRIDFIPSFDARLSDTMRRGVASVSGRRTVTPGNGVFLTSTATTGDASYSFTGLRSWSFTASAEYSRARSIGNAAGIYESTSGSLSMSRQIGRAVHLVANFSARQYSSPDFQNYNRLVYTARLGLGFAPGDAPLRVW